MAFEDAVVLCRLLKSKSESSGSALNSRKCTEALVREFEASRFDRVKTIWDNQWEISEGTYKKGADIKWSSSFANWVKDGV